MTGTAVLKVRVTAGAVAAVMETEVTFTAAADAGVSTASPYNAHLHAAPCSDAGGGGHYQNASAGPADATNENWPTVTCASEPVAGTVVCQGAATNAWVPVPAE